MKDFCFNFIFSLKERIIPIQLEQTPTYAAAQPSFNTQPQQYAGGNNGKCDENEIVRYFFFNNLTKTVCNSYDSKSIL